MKRHNLIIMIFSASYLFLLLIASSCRTTALERSFSPNETAEINLITENFDKIICQAFPASKEMSPITQYCNFILDDTISVESMENSHISKFAVSEIISNYNTFRSMKLFNEIWEFSYLRNHKTKNVVDTIIELNTNGKYFQYLKKLHKTNHLKYWIYEDLEAWGGGDTPYSFINFPNTCRLCYDSDENFRIVAAVYFFTFCFNELGKKNVIVFK